MEKQSILYVPTNMEQSTIDYICSGFDNMLRRHIDFHVIKKDSIIGGFLAEVEGEVYDAAIGSRLTELRKVLLEK